MQEYQNLVKQEQKLANKINIDVEQDIFLTYIGKKIRNLNKKLDQIKELENQNKESLTETQIEKINGKQKVEQDKIDFQNMRIHYLTSHQKVQDQKIEDIQKQSDTNIVKKTVKIAEEQILDNILNILQLGKFINDRNELPKQLNINTQQEEQIYTFYDKYMNFRPEIQDENLNLKSHKEKVKAIVLKYLNNEEQYSQLKQTIESISNDKLFQNIQISSLTKEELQSISETDENQQYQQENDLEIQKQNQLIQQEIAQQEQQKESTIEEGLQEQQENFNLEQNYDGDSEKSYKQSGSEQNKNQDSQEQNLTNLHSQTQSKEQQKPQNQKYIHKNKFNQNNYPRKNHYNNQNSYFQKKKLSNSKKFYNNQENQYSDHYQSNQQNRNNDYRKNNPNRNKYQYTQKDYDTDKEKENRQTTEYRPKYKY